MIFETVIWLEVHLKLNSPNKLFCRCKNEQEFDDLTANTHTCPTCMWQPWALPVLNKEPLDKAILLGLALWCEVQNISQFDRKSYFYPDLPMGYQITQLVKPTNIDGEVHFFVDKEFSESRNVRIRDAHIETDTWKSTHTDWSVLLDFNRAGTPLVEIVTHPDFTSWDEVIFFLKHLQRIARFNDIGDADMDKGQLRVDVNISLRQQWTEILWVRTETKNMNSFSAIQKAIEYEVDRQSKILQEWWTIDQETRWWDDISWTSFVMRSKEDAMDYRYFLEPDMPLVEATNEHISEVKQQLIEGPFVRISRYKNEYNFNKEYINALINDVHVNNSFEDAVSHGYSPSEVAKWIVWPIQRWLNESLRWFENTKFTQVQFLDFLWLIKDGSLANAQAKIVMWEMIETWKDANLIIEEKWLTWVGEDEVHTWLEEIFNAKPDILEDLKEWNMKPMWFVIGQVMQKSGWSADPAMVNSLIQKFL